MLINQILLIIILGLIFYQDLKERQVYWFLFPIIAICSGILFYNNTISELFYNAIAVNFLIISFILLGVFLYAKLKLKIKFSEAIGLGDILLFFGLCFTFSTLSFLFIFVFGLFFSLVIHIVIKRYVKSPTVPLAGYMSLFFAITYISYWTDIIDSLYTF